LVKKKKQTAEYSGGLDLQITSPKEEMITPTAASPTTPTYNEVPSPKTADWEQFADPNSGKPYYYNKASGVTQWETPDGM